MHGLINRSIQCFIRDNYGPEVWQNACRTADLGFDNFEAMLIYDDALTARLLTALATTLGREQTELLEDMGTYLVSHRHLENIRRLLRFGGDTFEEFLHSLDDLRDRARLALPDLDFPSLELVELGRGSYQLLYRWDKTGFGTVALGVMRAMADDYGALVLLDDKFQQVGGEDLLTIEINLIDSQHGTARSFDLGLNP